MKVGPLIKAIDAHNVSCADVRARIEWRLVHTGQHYDAKMSNVFFGELGLPAPDINLEVGSGSHATQTANIMTTFEPVCEHEKPDCVVVVGDVNSTLACTLVSAKLNIRVAHLEAGLRSFDRTMPEEVNRIVTDALADLLLTPSEDANRNLTNEGVPDYKIKLVGNIMIDALVDNLDKAYQRKTLEKLGLKENHFAYVTLHRPSNVDSKASLTEIIAELNLLSKQMPVVFPVHPRTRKMLVAFGIAVTVSNGLQLLDPIGYYDSINLTKCARFILTDSGGLQEEATFFRTPCLTLRPNTERPITVELGSNELTSLAELRLDIERVLGTAERRGVIPPFWDGHTAERAVTHFLAM